MQELAMYKVLVEAVQAGKDWVTIRKKFTGEEGVCALCKDGNVKVFYGADDGSDDKVLTPQQFEAKFIITGTYTPEEYEVEFWGAR